LIIIADYLHKDFLAACLKSAIKSLTSSSPTEQRISPSVIPSFALSSFESLACVVVYGLVIINSVRK